MTHIEKFVRMCNLNILLESQAVKTLLEKTIKVDDGIISVRCPASGTVIAYLCKTYFKLQCRTVVVYCTPSLIQVVPISGGLSKLEHVVEVYLNDEFLDKYSPTDEEYELLAFTHATSSAILGPVMEEIELTIRQLGHAAEETDLEWERQKRMLWGGSSEKVKESNN